MPPSQWVKDLQNRMPLGRDSTFDKMDAPVVVNPEELSKKASAKPWILPESIYGSTLSKEAKIQLEATINSPSRILTDLDKGFTK